MLILPPLSLLSVLKPPPQLDGIRGTLSPKLGKFSAFKSDAALPVRKLVSRDGNSSGVGGNLTDDVDTYEKSVLSPLTVRVPSRGSLTDTGSSTCHSPLRARPLTPPSNSDALRRLSKDFSRCSD